MNKYMLVTALTILSCGSMIVASESTEVRRGIPTADGKIYCPSTGKTVSSTSELGPRQYRNRTDDQERGLGRGQRKGYACGPRDGRGNGPRDGRGGRCNR
jgi:hypothetical protein